ncbi:MAG: HIT domain-containing protein [Anaerolineae bacterium]|nr:HIT domain-containing protein [Anaerolineae bacterium]NUQ04252.1 HIT domain-containing protein [Anaerolineae bacterium]
MDHLYTPWRMAYIRGETKPEDGGCVFCRLAAEPDNPQVIARSQHVFITLNIYPYSNGHLMIVPFEHVASQESLPVEALTDVMVTVNRALGALRRLYNPPAFNLGVNLGRAAGAGIAEHYHFHIVPRWLGDASFMTTIGETRVIPDSLENTAEQLRQVWRELYG